MKLRDVVPCLIFLPALASAQVYGDTVGCQMLAGERPMSDSMYLYDGTTIQRMESSCPVTRSLQVGAGGILLTVQCTGEGETWESFYMLMTTADEETLLIHPEAYPEFKTEIKVCDIK